MEELSTTAWAAVAYIVVFATLAPYVMQLWASSALPASLISAYYALQPVSAVLAKHGNSIEGFLRSEWPEEAAYAEALQRSAGMLRPTTDKEREEAWERFYRHGGDAFLQSAMKYGVR